MAEQVYIEFYLFYKIFGRNYEKTIYLEFYGLLILMCVI